MTDYRIISKFNESYGAVIFTIQEYINAVWEDVGMAFTLEAANRFINDSMNTPNTVNELIEE